MTVIVKRFYKAFTQNELPLAEDALKCSKYMEHKNKIVGLCCENEEDSEKDYKIFKKYLLEHKDTFTTAYKWFFRYQEQKAKLSPDQKERRREYFREYYHKQKNISVLV